MSKYSLSELKQIMKENKIKGITIMNKPEILKLVIEKGLIPDETLVKSTNPTTKDIKPNYEFVRYIRHAPRKVIITDSETGTETEYPSIYRAGRTLGCSAKAIVNNNGKIWRKRYKIDITSN